MNEGSRQPADSAPTRRSVGDPGSQSDRDLKFTFIEWSMNAAGESSGRLAGTSAPRQVQRFRHCADWHGQKRPTWRCRASRNEISLFSPSKVDCSFSSEDLIAWACEVHNSRRSHESIYATDQPIPKDHEEATRRVSRPGQSFPRKYLHATNEP